MVQAREPRKKKTATTARKARDFANGFPSALHQKYLLIFMMHAGGDAEAALSMLRREHRLKLPWQDWDNEKQRLYIEDFVFSLAWPDLLAKIEHLPARETGIVSRARILLAETRAAKWVRTMNRQQALTPTSREVVGFSGARAPLQARPDLRTPGAQRKWASRWRERWRGRLGRFAAGEIDDIQTLRAKAVWVSSRDPIWPMCRALF